MRKLFLIFLLMPIFSIAQKLEGQKLIDSLLVELPKMKEDSLKVNLLNDLANKSMNSNMQNIFKYSDIALNLAIKINWDDGKANSYKNIGTYYFLTSQLDKCLQNYKSAYDATKNLKIKSKILLGFGNIYSKQNNYPKALEYYYKSLSYFEAIGDQETSLKALNNIGNIYLNLKDYKKANKIFLKCLKINDVLKSNFSPLIFANLSISYYNLSKFKEATYYGEKCIKICEQIGDKYNLSKALSILGFISSENENPNAILFLEKSLKLKYELNDKDGISETLMNIGHIKLLQSNKTKDKDSTNIDLKIAEENLKKSLVGNQISILKSHTYYDLFLTQKNQGNYQEAIKSLEKHFIYKDSVFNSENKETIKNLEDKREIELRDKEIKINKLSLEAKEKQKWLYVAGIVFLAIIGGLLFYQSRKRKLTNLKLETLNKTLDQNNLKLETLNKDLDQANKAKTRFFGILNHDLRGPVSNLVIFLQLQQEAPEMLDEESTKRMQDKTMTGAKNLLASMEDILQWSKSQMENFKPQPKNISINQLFDDTIKVFSGYLNINIEYQNPDNIEIFTDDNYLKTIIRNLTSNAINVFINIENPTIIWKAWQKDKISYLSITDNGPGANPEKLKALFEESELGSTKSGLGLHLIRDMAKAIDCEISVESTIGIGTTFTLKLN